jgi:hypothetical protein
MFSFLITLIKIAPNTNQYKSKPEKKPQHLKAVTGKSQQNQQHNDHRSKIQAKVKKLHKNFTKNTHNKTPTIKMIDKNA